jgi:hypothetical protein
MRGSKRGTHGSITRQRDDDGENAWMGMSGSSFIFFVLSFASRLSFIFILY